MMTTMAALLGGCRWRWERAQVRSCGIRWASRLLADCWSASCSLFTPRRSSTCGSTAWRTAFLATEIGNPIEEPVGASAD